ncbi:MAG: hypothetical protein ACOCQG_00645 [Candidatus Nanoarchaeia archaeon]
MSKKDECKKIMGNEFGPNAAEKVDSMDEETCVQQCKRNVKAFLGDAKAEELFANIK